MSVELAGSLPADVPAAAPNVSLQPLAADTPVTVLVALQRRAPLVPDAAAPISRATLTERYGADPAALERVLDHGAAHGLTVIAADADTRLVSLAGTAEQVSAAYGTGLVAFGEVASGGPARVPTGPVRLPEAVAADVVAVLGLDTRKAARHQTAMRPGTDVAAAYTPVELAARYRFPGAADGTGETVGILELGGGYRRADLIAYADALGVPHPHVTAVSVQGARNTPTGDPSGPDGEVALDVEVIAAAAPGARIAVYFAPNTDAGFLGALSAAVHDNSRAVSVVSVSWGSAEETWSVSARAAFDAALADAAALGVTVCVASGDDGSSDRVSDGAAHTDFPAASPHALACGGTSLPRSGAEVVWNDGPGRGAGGGGVSAAFPLPDFQHGLVAAGKPLTGRGVPDVAADADPATGYRVRIDGSDTVIGGTSAAAPLWAALIARLQQANGARRWLTPLLYRFPAGTLHDVTTGNNGAFSAGAGWDPCTGLGSPDGTALAAALSAVRSALSAAGT